MSLPLQDRAQNGDETIVRMTLADLGQPFESGQIVTTLNPKLIPDRPLADGEQYRFHFNVTKCIGCRSCEIACNEQNGNPADILWRRIGEIEGGVYPDTHRHYLSMGCNHCLDAECVKGCPVDAYTKDPVTGIVLHSADACIGCQYCVWNCPYSVPQFNAARGVVGKCDMCHGRLTDGLEPACVNACPEAAIEIEIVDKTAWRIDYAAAESPGMPAAGLTISTTRITLPPNPSARLERVDSGRIHPEHAHPSLVFMTTLTQAATGSLIFLLLQNAAQPLQLTLLFFVTLIALSISVFHLGRPAYAWRALKMWRRSWLSREVLFFGLFFATLTAFTITSWIAKLPPALTAVLPLSGLNSTWLQDLQTFPFTPNLLLALGWTAALFGIAGTIASAFIYLVPARPAWNLIHTPIDFLLSAGFIGATLPLTLNWIARHLAHFRLLRSMSSPTATGTSTYWPVLFFAALWTVNQVVRLVRLNTSGLFEERATAELLNTQDLRPAVICSFGLAAASAVLAFCGAFAYAMLAAFAAVLLVRYLFFVSVVPLNMALTFTRGGSH
ncbi:MAG: dimethyl sulfoxide reductase anchor subunit [Acidobacteriota bacterium]|nr:dimethyl sulfoxide reductase anchor subunit [Acidobacteriota bacterium]